MTVPTSCKNFCATLRRMGFTEDLEKPTSEITTDAMITAATKMQWSERTCQRYLGDEGILVKFGYLEVTEDGEYRLTGEDLNE